MASKEERQKRGKYRILKLGEKLDVLSDIKKGLSYTTIMQKYKISKTTVYDIKKSELKLTKFVDSTEKDVKKFSQVKNPLYENVDKAVNIWYESRRLSGVPICGVELQTAASHFASKLNNPTFKASGGWLSRYRARHNLKNKKVVGEALSADEDAANRFKDDFHKLMTDEKYEQFQIYNADETGVYWKSLPDNSQVKNANSASGHKQSKDRLSVLLCANADASHKNVLAVVGKSKRPRAIKNIIDRMPVHYYSSHKAWFNQSIFSEWFFKRFINEVRNFQENKLRVAPDQVKALLLVDNSPAHPTELISNDGNIKCKFLPPNTTSVLQPMDQGVIVAFKRLYKRRQLESCLVFSSDADQPNNSVGEQTFSNLKKYDIKKAIFNFGNSWDELKSSTIRNGWKILLEHKNNSDLETAGDALQLSEDESDEDEQEIRRLEQLFQRARIEVNQESINEWIDIDLDDPGHNVLSNDDIVEAVLSEKMEISSSDDSSSTSEDSLEPDVPRCEALKSLDVALKYLEKRTEPEMLASYNTINSLRTMLMREEEALEIVYHAVRGLLPRFETIATVLRLQRSSSLEEVFQALQEEEMRLHSVGSNDGYSRIRKSYRIYDPQDGKIHEAQTVKIDENSKGSDLLNSSVFDQHVQDQITYRNKQQESDFFRITPTVCSPLEEPNTPENPEPIPESSGLPLNFGREPCAYILQEKENTLIIGIHVDDFVIIGSNSTIINRRVKQLEKQIFIVREEKAIFFLGIKVEKRENCFELSQEAYVENILKKYNLAECNPVKTPGDLYQDLDNHPDTPVDPKLYQEIIGSLMYQSVGTRPDIRFYVRQLSQYNKDPKVIHLTALKRIYRYSLGSSLLSWKSQKQSLVALSTCEAELMAICEGTEGMKWFMNFLSEIGQQSCVGIPLVLKTDSNSAIDLIKGTSHHCRTEHINRKYFFVKDEVSKGNLRISFINSESREADIFTKRLPEDRIQRLLVNMGLLFGLNLDLLTKGGVVEISKQICEICYVLTKWLFD
ncbi:hypothetical protein LAZ67_15001048 [Cordylochernes scorpioides]|uniref:HTH CENPB-type domain-containing protein n=1 Tax=Cordylochernes scorpioides TaxID=51811 RepID=A0ABY6L8I0_9ARAC|nr:hypothetical protein LAZ67_15001048 [Cordylochernes scorpioides]